MAQKIYIDCKLSKLIESASVTTWDDVVTKIREYITRKNLFDTRKMKIVCHKDELGNLFGVSEFTILDIAKLLRKLVTPITQHAEASLIKNNVAGSPTSVPLFLKRKNEDSSEEESKAPKKKSTHISNTAEISNSCNTGENLTRGAHTASSPMILEIPVSPKVSELDCEYNSADSVETSLIRDSDENDRSTVATFVTLETYDVEFEPLSSSEDHSDNESDSEMDLALLSELSSIVTFVANLESDLEEYLADMSSEESASDDSASALSAFDFDAEIGLLDNWQCSSCLSKNTPINRYCSKCFCIRKGWCNVEKNVGLKKRRRKPRSKRKKHKSKKDRFQIPMPIEPAKSNDRPCTSNNSSMSKSDSLCLLCCANPVNSSIIHGVYAHSIACYECASKLKQRDARCPICRRNIEKVVFQI